MFGQVLEIDESQSSAVCIWPPRPSIGANTHSNRRLISGLSGNFRFQPTIQFWRKDEKTKFSPATGVCIKPCDEAKSVQEKRFQPVWLGKCHIGQIGNFVQGKFPQGWKGSSNTLCSEQISQNFFCPSFFKINERQKEVCLSLNLKAKLVSSKLYTCVRQSLLSIYYGDHYLHLHIIQHTYMTGVLKRALPDIIITLWTKKTSPLFFRRIGNSTSIHTFVHPRKGVGPGFDYQGSITFFHNFHNFSNVYWIHCLPSKVIRPTLHHPCHILLYSWTHGEQSGAINNMVHFLQG